MSEAGERPGFDGVVEDVLAAVGDPALVCDSDGTVRAHNEAFAGLAGADTTATGRAVGTLVEWVGDDPVAWVLAGGEETSGQCRLADDGRRYGVTARPLTDGGTVVGAVAVLRDGGGGERTRELAAANERLDLALETTGAGVHVWHIGENRVYWHETTSRLFGLDPDTTYRTRAAFSDRVHPEDREKVLAAVEDAIEGDGQVHVEYRLHEDVDGNGDGTETDPEGRTRWMVTEGEIIYEDGEPDRLVGIVRDVTDRKERERELVEREQRLRAVLESSADPIAMQDTDGRFRVVNEAMVEVAGRPRETLYGTTHADVFDDETAARIESHCQDVLETERARVVEEVFPATGEGRDRAVQLTVAPYYGSDERVRGTVTIARDITELERQRDELETLAAIQAVVQESVRAVTAATTREEIKRSVAERLADSAFYEAAWVGSREAATGEVTPDHATPGAAAYLDAVSVRTDAAARGEGPGETDFRTGEVQVVDDVREDPSFEPWRDLAVEYGFESAAAIPLTHGSTTHGILAVYTDRPGSFSERETEGFETLGAAVGFALSAAQHRRLLEADRVLELEYTVESDQSPFVRISAARDCRFVVDSAVHASDGTVVNYLTVEGCDPDNVSELLRDIDNLVSMRRLDGDDGPHFELKWADSVFQYLAEAGARGERGVAEDGVGRMHVVAPGDVDVRRITEAMEGRFDAVTLAAKRERDRSDPPWWGTHGDIGTRLTDRQRGVLQAAYYSGYYAWPRDTDAETLADSLDVATPTLLQHLRKGHRRVLEAMFDA